MITPNKFIAYADSALGHAEKIFSAIDDPIAISELFKKTASKSLTIEIFIYTIEILHLSNAVHVNLTTGIVSRC